MKHFCYFRLPLLILFSFLIFSCASRKKMAYYQNIGDIVQGSESSQNYEPVLEADDQIKIIVVAENQEVASPFNVSRTDAKSGVSTPGQETNIYLIDNQGYIQFPVIGKIKLGGLTKSQAVAEMNSVLRKYVTEASVTISILNYKVTVQGEVARPGTFNVQSERLTLPEALAMAGDLTIYGKRENVMIVREKLGKKTVERVDITKADFINSPYYYLAQNDLIYVEPNRARINSSKTDPNVGIIISSVSLLITIIVLITK